MAYSGLFRPRNPQKYVGDPRNIVYRSSWECRCMDWFDRNPDILSWASEELIIPYKSPVDGKFHRYFPDFLVKLKTKDGKTKTLLIEVKPKYQTVPPVQPSRKTKRFINEVMTYGVNQAKWKAATEYCLDRGWEFQIITEDHLGL
jgi:hypothetical protein